MTNAALTAMRHLRDELLTKATGMEAEFTSFASGSVMLDIRLEGRAFVMAYCPKWGYAVDELHSSEGFISSYKFNSETFEDAATQLRALASAESPPKLSLLVLHCRDLESTREFYQLLGLRFIEEQHGGGPRHYSTTLDGIVIEFYPCQGISPSTPVRVGFRVASLDRTLENLRNRGARIVREAKDSPWGRRAIAEDPDGNRVELTLGV